MEASEVPPLVALLFGSGWDGQGNGKACIARYSNNYKYGNQNTEQLLVSFQLIGRTDEAVSIIEAYLRANRMFVDYNEHGQTAELKQETWEYGTVVIAAITSCTNTSNPTVMICPSLIAKIAWELGLEVKPWIKTSLAPGSGVFTKYLLRRAPILNTRGIHDMVIRAKLVLRLSLATASCTALIPWEGLLNSQWFAELLNNLGFHLVGYGCATCIGNSGYLDANVAGAITVNGTHILSLEVWDSYY
uniref:Aconitase/3-isopropylmalate dehydratase large subunit alpha/beta/alpha domain-containing protein n=1 Tax=Leersia perrieri TaxID=77586 RepID=A0A0D9WPM4_9ORYZ